MLCKGYIYEVMNTIQALLGWSSDFVITIRPVVCSTAGTLPGWVFVS